MRNSHQNIRNSVTGCSGRTAELAAELLRLDCRKLWIIKLPDNGKSTATDEEYPSYVLRLTEARRTRKIPILERRPHGKISNSVPMDITYQAIECPKSVEECSGNGSRRVRAWSKIPGNDRDSSATRRRKIAARYMLQLVIMEIIRPHGKRLTKQTLANADLIRAIAFFVTLAAGTLFNAETVQAGVAKPHPKGIIRLLNVDSARPDRFSAWTNPNLSGMRVRPHWSDVQPGPSTYDWSKIDQILSLGAQYNKSIGLSVAAGIYAPQWIYGAGATCYTLSDHSGTMPLPWDNAFANQWQTFIRKLGARYDGNPALKYVVISGLGQSIETFLAKTPADAEALTALGGPTAWVRAAKQIITTYADAFPTTPFFMTLAIPLFQAPTRALCMMRRC